MQYDEEGDFYPPHANRGGAPRRPRSPDATDRWIEREMRVCGARWVNGERIDPNTGQPAYLSRGSGRSLRMNDFLDDDYDDRRPRASRDDDRARRPVDRSVWDAKMCARGQPR